MILHDFKSWSLDMHTYYTNFQALDTSKRENPESTKGKTTWGFSQSLAK